MDPGHLPAVYLLVKLYNEEKNIDKAIETYVHQSIMLINSFKFSQLIVFFFLFYFHCRLLNAIEEESNEKLHRMLGDCYKEKNEQDKALHHHNIASK